MNSSYPDRWFILIGCLLLGYFFVTIGLDESLFALLQKPTYIRDLFGATLMSGIVWLLVRAATVTLDRRYDWFEQPLRRIAGQSLLGFGGPVVVSFLMALLYFRFVVGQPITESTFPVYEFPISVLVILFINLFYVGLYLYKRATGTPPVLIEAPGTAQPVVRKTLIVASGQRNIPLATADVAYFYIDEGAVFVTTFTGEKYVVGATLDDLARDLPTTQFFRVNRQFLIHRRACSSYLNDSYGKLKLEVQPTVRREIIVSQQKAPEFKKWLEEAH
ncbi:LytR/AlgR family response regulator transcription factor [Tellurirhabdus rosea]|uniref:LytR/AlgR family response regulator transcription factor n=1 Tax=Tellurirhabdus rosea TaxID=2674997 RepID=UPI002250461D|nr:LytTR family DNA-binding domain-containing protein [Tellurirhabdus rosea]